MLAFFVVIASLIGTSCAQLERGRAAHVLSNSKIQYILQDNITGSSFFDRFDFFNDPDPTHGFITYVDQATAFSQRLASANSSTVMMKVDNAAKSIGPRNSVRLTSKKAYEQGIFVLDLEHMPSGCATWPAFWLVGPNWPTDGEIDVIEGVNAATSNTVTLHTNKGCTQGSVPDSAFRGKRSVGTDGTSPAINCFIQAPGEYSNQGCGIIGSEGSYGAPFNAGRGGVFATVWNASGIAVYFWPRPTVPAGIRTGDAPDPDDATWGKPMARFGFGTDCPSQHFTHMNIVFDLVLCGDWAGNVFQSNCPGMGTCQDFVMNNPDKLQEAYWSIKSLKVYEPRSAVWPPERRDSHKPQKKSRKHVGDM